MEINKSIQKVQWECVHFVAKLENSELEDSGQMIVRMDASDIDTEEKMFKELCRSLKFPDYFGNNWDAVDECLRDLEWLPSINGYVLVVENSGKLWSMNPLLAGNLVESWLFSAEEWSKEQKSFHLIFELGDKN